MDALKFAEYGMEELHARLKAKAEVSEEETVRKFLADQGHNFVNVDIKEILKLAHSK